MNMVPEDSINKYELLQLFNRELRGGSVEIVPDAGLQLDKTPCANQLRTDLPSEVLPGADTRDGRMGACTQGTLPPLRGDLVMSKLKLMVVMGTRPEIIKLSEVVRKADEYLDLSIVHTGRTMTTS